MKYIDFFLILFLKILTVRSTRVKGTWNTADDFFFFLLKFGFQKTDLHNPDSSGFVYGNITTDNQKFVKSATFIIVDYDNFFEYYKSYKYNKLSKNKEKLCSQMFSKFSIGKCDDNYLKNINYISEIPCPKERLCENSGDVSNLVRGSQFSYQIKDYQYPR